MKVRIMNTVAIMGLLVALCAGDALAAGKGRGGANGSRNATCANPTAAGGTAIRPADSQRRDGTFLTTGTTANGATVRPANGNGLRDGSRLTTTP